LFDTSAAGILLADPNGHLGVWGSSSGRMRRTELFELQVAEGPCLECYRTGKAIVEPDLAGSRRWRQFEPVALAAGFASVHAVPIRTGEHVIGALNLFRAQPGRLGAADMLAAQALAQATALAILRHPDGDEHPGTRFALDNQVIEQAKGVLAGRAGVRVDEAFSRILRYSHHHKIPLVDVCHEVVNGSLRLTTFHEDSLQRPKYLLERKRTPPGTSST
jgi:GAF domain-containing protein